MIYTSIEVLLNSQNHLFLVFEIALNKGVCKKLSFRGQSCTLRQLLVLRSCKSFKDKNNTVSTNRVKLSHKSSLKNYKDKALQGHFQQLCADKYAYQRKVWSTIKPYINSRKSKHNRRIVLKEKETWIL